MRKTAAPSSSSATLRNTVCMRDVLAIRLSDAERAQVAGAAARLELTVSGFVRQAALQASAVVGRKVSVQAPEPLERESLGVVLLDPEQSSHAFVDGICKRCGVDVDGSDLPCVDRAASR
jgi:uncharacterized protein (DUF1778 family)